MVSGTLVEWATLTAIVFGPGIGASLLWGPLLGVDRFESLFERLRPDTPVLLNYFLVMIALSLPWVGGGYVSMVRAPSEELVTANALLDVVVALSVVYLFGLPLIAGVVLPRIGTDWDRTGYGLRTWVLLVVGVLWYVVLLALPIFALSTGLALAGGP